MKISTTAKINIRKICQYITNVRINDGSWRGPTSAFLTHWTEQVHIYDENVDSTVKLSNEAKRQFLENTVQNHTEFCTVKIKEDMVISIGSTPMNFQQYYDFLRSDAQRHDEIMSRTKKSSRYVYNYEITQDDEEHYADAEEGYDIDTPVEMIQTNFHNSTRQANVNQRRPPAHNKTRIPSNAWS